MEEPMKGQTLDTYSYEIGAERFVVMENMFTPINQKEGLLEAIKRCYEKNGELEKKIVLCGGMATCDGIVERILQDDYFRTFSIDADENFMWKQAVCIVKEMNNK